MNSFPDRTLVIGDVHGCLDELDELLRTLQHRRDRDRLVFVGDFLDRGPDPVGAVRRARELGAEAVLGNHEEKHLRWRSHEERALRDPKYHNPMQALGPEKLRAHAALRDDDWAWIDALPVLLRLAPGWLVAHAGLEPARPVEKQREDALLRIRYVDEGGKLAAGLRPRPNTHPWATRWRGPDHVIYGHQVHDLEAPRIDEPTPGVRCWGLDTGCCFGGRLTALVLPDEEIVQVDARATYAKLRHTDD
jgi:bis(5'-nucleosyl)-tetraphosphatase (symmetrical)